MLEKTIEEQFRKAVQQAGGRAYKFISPGNSGVPDRLVIFPEGRIGFVELKQSGKVPTRLQELQLKRLQELGCHTAVLDRLEDIPEVIEKLRKGEAPL